MTEDGKFGDKCFHDNRGDLDLVVAMDTLVISFPGRQLIEADNFTFTLTVSAPNKTSQSAFQVIHMVQKKSEMSKYDPVSQTFLQIISISNLGYFAISTMPPRAALLK